MGVARNGSPAGAAGGQARHLAAHRHRPSPQVLARRRRARLLGRMRLAGLLGLVALAVTLAITASGGAPAAGRSHRPAGAAPHPPGRGHRLPAATTSAQLPFVSRAGTGLAPGPNLAPGSDPAVLPGDVLIADEENNRLVAVDPTGKVVWQYPPPGAPASMALPSPDDAFFTPDHRGILATEENDQAVSLVDLASQQITWRYGTPGLAGGAPNQLDNPDDAMMLPDGDVLIADIKECSLLLVAPGGHTPLQRIGMEDPNCLHDPPLRFGSPNGAFPLTDGNYLVTEINGDWVDEVTLSGRVLWSTHPPGVAYPSDTNEVSPGVFITADYSTPGQIVEFNAAGKLLWRYGPASGPGMLRTPSLCEPIPTNGDILCNDDGNDRVIVVDPRTDRIVWQYGHTGVAGSGPGYLSGPDGVDLAPPYSLLLRHAATMGLPALACAANLPAGSCQVFAGAGAATAGAKAG